VILECGLKPHTPFFKNEEAKQLIEIALEVFIKCQSDNKESISYCLWTICLYTQKYEGSCEHLLSLFTSHSPYLGKKFVGFFSLD